MSSKQGHRKGDIGPVGYCRWTPADIARIALIQRLLLQRGVSVAMPSVADVMRHSLRVAARKAERITRRRDNPEGK